MSQGSTPLALLALLLFAVPSVFTLQKFVELLIYGEASHQLVAAHIQPITYVFFFFEALIHPVMAFYDFG